MILLLDSRDSVCRIIFVSGDKKFSNEWQSDRNLANGLLKYLQDNLESQGWNWQDIEAIGVYEGPGSFTSLRIGLTVANTLADSLSIPIVGASGDNWQEEALARISNKENAQIVMPLYGSEANITTPRK